MTRYGSFSFPDDFIYIWKKFHSIARREGKTSSSLLRDFVSEYVDVHDPGNPQLRITSFSVDGPKTIETIIGQIRQQCWEYASKHNNEIQLRIIHDLLRESELPRNKIEPLKDRISSWLREHEVKIWG